MRKEWLILRMAQVVSKRKVTIMGFNFIEYFLKIMVEGKLTIEEIFQIYQVDPSNLEGDKKTFHDMLKYLKVVEGLVISNTKQMILTDDVVVETISCDSIHIHLLESQKSEKILKFIDYYACSDLGFL